MAKIELMGPGPPDRQYRWKILLYAKNAKETEGEITGSFFCHIFIIDCISNGGAGPLSLFLATPMLVLIQTNEVLVIFLCLQAKLLLF